MNNKTAVYFPGLIEENSLQLYPSKNVLPFVPQIKENNRVVLLKKVDENISKISSQRRLVRRYEKNALTYMRDRNVTT